MSLVSLTELAELDTDETFELVPPIQIAMELSEPPTPSVLKNLARLNKLGICTPEAIMSLVGQAPIEPINLMVTLMRLQPGGWAFSAIDFSMIRVLARNKKTVSAAIRVDLMGTS